MEKKWYTLYTKPRAEKKVCENLTRKKIENYLPLNRIVGDWSTKKIIDEPLFASYIFVRATKPDILELKKIPGVVNLVYWLGKPVIIDDLEINTIKNFLNTHINVTSEKIIIGRTSVQKKTDISSTDTGSLTAVKNKQVNVVLPSLGYIISAEVEISNVRIISSNNLIRPKITPPRLFNPVHSFNNLFKN